ncbi:MAG: tRNA dimethylallyltransferase [Planctomycetota bacterium]|nr:MAG: tRNA dimethylallyltransferase [Planctomycetota bacterium]
MIQRVLVGGTASGKKRVAAELFRRHGLRPLSMDSMKVYRGMDVGTDKPSTALREETDYGLIDLVAHHERFSSGHWIDAAVQAVASGSAPVLFAGGTPLYLRLLLRGVFPGPRSDPAIRARLQARWETEGETVLRDELARVDPDLEARLFPGDAKRVLRGLEVWEQSGRPLSVWQAQDTTPPIAGRFVVCALRHEPTSHLARCAERAAAMFREGLLPEVAALAALAPFAEEPARSIGYLEALEHLDGKLSLDAAVERTVVRTRQLVRKQRMFLSTFPELRWVDVPADASLESVLPEVEAALELPGAGAAS